MLLKRYNGSCTRVIRYIVKTVQRKLYTGKFAIYVSPTQIYASCIVSQNLCTAKCLLCDFVLQALPPASGISIDLQLSIFCDAGTGVPTNCALCNLSCHMYASANKQALKHALSGVEGVLCYKFELYHLLFAFNRENTNCK